MKLKEKSDREEILLCDQSEQETILTSDLLERVKTFSTSELCDGAGVLHAMDASIRQYVGKGRVAGRAVTVDVPSGESAIVTKALETLREGDILVISGKGNCDCSYWGDYRSFCAAFQKAEAVVIDGAFRDIEECEEIGFPVFARGVTCRAGLKTGKGAVNVPVSCGGVVVFPGDLIAGDRNGVCVLRPGQAEAAMQSAIDKRKREEAAIARMKETGVLIPAIPKS